MKNKTSRLTMRFGVLLLIALFSSTVFFLVLRFGGAAVMESYFERTGF